METLQVALSQLQKSLNEEMEKVPEISKYHMVIHMVSEEKGLDWQEI